jgi:hypothetical protein
VARKLRQCKFAAIAGSKFCASHCSDLEGKIECPYEKGFFVNVSKFEKHLKNCPKLVNKQREEKNEWFSKDINKKDENIQEAHIDEVQNLHEVPD